MDRRRIDESDVRMSASYRRGKNEIKEMEGSRDGWKESKRGGETEIRNSGEEKKKKSVEQNEFLSVIATEPEAQPRSTIVRLPQMEHSSMDPYIRNLLLRLILPTTPRDF